MKIVATTLITLFCTATVAQSTHTLDICEPDTKCTRCSERNTFTLTPNQEKKTLSYNGVSPDGIPQMGEVVDCEFKNARNWVCKDGRALMTSVDGKVTLTYIGRQLTVDGKPYEVCLK